MLAGVWYPLYWIADIHQNSDSRRLMYFRGQKELAAYEFPENFLHVTGEPGIARGHGIPATLTSRATGMYVCIFLWHWNTKYYSRHIISRLTHTFKFISKIIWIAYIYLFTFVKFIDAGQQRRLLLHLGSVHGFHPLLSPLWNWRVRRVPSESAILVTGLSPWVGFDPTVIPLRRWKHICPKL